MRNKVTNNSGSTLVGLVEVYPIGTHNHCFVNARSGGMWDVHTNIK